jgi:hypothetical protein
VAFYLGLFAYFGMAGMVAGGGRDGLVRSAFTGALTAAIIAVLVLVTFVVIDNLFLDVVMQQPDKASGFRHSGLVSQRDYVNQGNRAAFVVVPVFAAIGAGFGTLGGLLRRLVSPGRRISPPR